ncbi:MAG: tetratricopeptide repeat protein [Zoogloeaceae bacterium]|jgi:predicted negative regulator of RcsB-dependent stress response|nr:tetratricopeptide repeat protein [Zoogloeaceae bacterium]
MAAYDLEEQEQIANLKAWWQTYGTRITIYICVMAIAVVGWQGWNWRQHQQNSRAGVVYAALFQAIGSNNPMQARSLVGELTENFSGTNYARMGALLAAKYAFESGDAKTARAQLDWAVEHSKGELADLARLRLAALLLDEKAYDEALSKLDHKPADAFLPAYAELKGDILVAQEKPAEARAAYQTALQALKARNTEETDTTETPATPEDKTKNEKPESPVEIILQQKLDALGAA